MQMVCPDSHYDRTIAHQAVKSVCSMWDKLQHYQSLSVISKQPLAKIRHWARCSPMCRMAGHDMFLTLKPYHTQQNEIGTESGCLVGNSNYCARKAASESIAVPPWDSSRSYSNESNHQKLLLVKWTGQSYWNPCKVVSCVSSLASHSPSCTSTSWVWPETPWRRVHVDFAGPF